MVSAIPETYKIRTTKPHSAPLNRPNHNKTQFPSFAYGKG